MCCCLFPTDHNHPRNKRKPLKAFPAQKHTLEHTHTPLLHHLFSLLHQRWGYLQAGAPLGLSQTLGAYPPPPPPAHWPQLHLGAQEKETWAGGGLPEPLSRLSISHVPRFVSQALLGAESGQLLLGGRDGTRLQKPFACGFARNVPVQTLRLQAEAVAPGAGPSVGLGHWGGTGSSPEHLHGHSDTPQQNCSASSGSSAPAASAFGYGPLTQTRHSRGVAQELGLLISPSCLFPRTTSPPPPQAGQGKQKLPN